MKLFVVNTGAVIAYFLLTNFNSQEATSYALSTVALETCCKQKTG